MQALCVLPRVMIPQPIIKHRHVILGHPGLVKVLEHCQCLICCVYADDAQACGAWGGGGGGQVEALMGEAVEEV